jgi:hypothetical protein
VLGTTVFGTGDDDRVDDVALTPRRDVLVVFASGVSYTAATLAKFSPCGSEAWSVSAGTLSSGGLAVHPTPRSFKSLLQNVAHTVHHTPYTIQPEPCTLQLVPYT